MYRFLFMKPIPRFFRIHLFVGLSWAQTVVSLFAAEKPASPETPGSKQVDPGWPREVTRNGIRFVYYQPQVDEWKDFRELRARLAFVLTPKDGKPAVGIEELKGRTTANVEARTVLIDSIEITAVRFPALSSDGGHAYGPYANAGRAAWYNPATGGYGRVYTEQTPYGGRTSAWGYNPKTDTAWNTQQGHNSYAQQQRWEQRTNRGSNWQSNRGSRNWGGGGSRGRFRD